MPDTLKGRQHGEKSFIKGLSFIASSSGDANTSVVDVKQRTNCQDSTSPFSIGNMIPGPFNPGKSRPAAALLNHP